MPRAGFWTGVAPIHPFSRLIKVGRRVIIILVLCLSWLVGSLPAQAASPVDPNLKQQVLQIIRENPEVILETVGEYQRQQQQVQERERQSFLQSLKTNPKGVIGQSPTIGVNNGKVLLIEFSDFQCPFCAKAHDTLQQLMVEHQETVTLVYKHFPLTSIHDQALPAAKAAWAAGQQGKFWEYHDALFTQQNQLGEDLYLATAKALQLNLNQFERDRTSKTASTAIEQDLQLAEQLGLEGTPSFIVSSDAFSGAIQLGNLAEFLAQFKPAEKG